MRNFQSLEFYVSSLSHPVPLPPPHCPMCEISGVWTGNNLGGLQVFSSCASQRGGPPIHLPSPADTCQDLPEPMAENSDVNHPVAHPADGMESSRVAGERQPGREGSQGLLLRAQRGLGPGTPGFSSPADRPQSESAFFFCVRNVCSIYSGKKGRLK